MKTFWMVWNNKRNIPSCQHSSKTSAKKEAQRLAIANPSDVFVILESIGHYATVEPVKFTKHERNEQIVCEWREGMGS